MSNTNTTQQPPAKTQYITGGWTHIFAGDTGDRMTRVLLDVSTQKLVHAEIQRNHAVTSSYTPATPTEADDLQDSLINANSELFDDPEGFGLEFVDEIPAWVSCEFTPGQVVFYTPDPANHGPIVIRFIDAKVEGFSTYKNLILSFEAADLCSPADIGNELVKLVFANEEEVMHRSEKIIARIAVLQRAAELASK
jgi:hypothetical protein